eukprot:CAMPEP_0181120668 /NCGR_PEP_ID=MMETSP1071-20121207/24286_1 /TAXON_ID=35127 /ORGANISM="Thalassiosira sp., Strain NH16" /LENGTH=103 /DNA_ID=CAMNT_0023205353 /DNA_START=88 /DNA_END=399 /DNA_ORIENTATION=+
MTGSNRRAPATKSPKRGRVNAKEQPAANTRHASGTTASNNNNLTRCFSYESSGDCYSLVSGGTTKVCAEWSISRLLDRDALLGIEVFVGNDEIEVTSSALVPA